MTSWKKQKSCQTKAVFFIVLIIWIGELFNNWKVALIIFPGFYLAGLLFFKYIPFTVKYLKKISQKCPHKKFGGETLNRCLICDEIKSEIEKQRIIDQNNKENLRKIEIESIKKEEFIRKRFLELRKLERLKIRELLNLNFENIVNVNPHEFESLIAKLYSEYGYSVRQTSKSNDGGRDLILKKEKELIIVECKRYNINQKIGRPIIQKFHSAKITDKANKGILVTTSYFTTNVYSYPSVKSGLIELVNREKLKMLLLEKFGEFRPNSFQDVCLECGLEYEHRFSNSDYCENGHKGDYITLDDFLNSSTTFSNI